jgi:hypothetical protein
MRNCLILFFILVPSLSFADPSLNASIHSVALKVMVTAADGYRTILNKVLAPTVGCLYAGKINGFIESIRDQEFSNSSKFIKNQIKELVNISYDLDNDCLKTMSFESLNKKFNKIFTEANKLALLIN